MRFGLQEILITSIIANLRKIFKMRDMLDFYDIVGVYLINSL